MPSISFPCPSCRAPIDYEGPPGAKIKCPTCGQKLKTPGPASDKTMLVTDSAPAWPSAPPAAIQQPEQAARCHHCGNVFPVTKLVRSEEKTGQTCGYIGGAFSASHFGLVDLCYLCAEESNRRRRANRMLTGALVGAFVLLLAVLMIVVAIANKR